MADTSRLDELEIRIAHQDQVIDELNATVMAQWKEIDRLKREMERLADQVATSSPGDPQDEPPPPHW